MIVYLDGVIGLNFLVDLCLLLGVNRLAGYPPGYKRAAAAAMVGGGYAGACMVPSFTFLSSDLWRIVSLGLVSMTAFGIHSGAIRRGVLFVLLSMAMGGLVMCFDTGNLVGLMGCAVVLALLCGVGFRGKANQRTIVPVILRHGDREVRLNALVDTGNTLRDPVTGETVLVAGPETAQKLASLTPEQLRNPADTMAQVPGLRLIPCRTVSGPSLMAAIKCDEVRIGNQKGGRLVAFSPNPFPGGEYQALTGGQYG